MANSAPAATAAATPEQTLSAAIDATENLGSGVRGFAVWVTSIEGQAIAAIGAAAIVALALLAGRRWLRQTLARQEPADPHRTRLALELVRRFLGFFAVMAGLRVGLSLVDAPDSVDDATQLLFTLAASLQGAIWVQTIAVHLLARFVDKHEGKGSTIASAFVLLRWLVTVVVWSIALLIFLDNLGVNITALVAGLGVGGVAIALAAQSTIGNFFSAFSIIADRPFQRGDLIRFAGVTARVEEIGLRTTRLRSLDGHEVVVANSKLLDELIDNLQRMDERRAIVTIGVAYETPPAILRTIPDLLKDCVDMVDAARFDRCHLATFGPSSLDFELVFFARGRDYPLLMAAKQEVLFNVFEAFAARAIAIAYPTQTIYVAKAETLA